METEHALKMNNAAVWAGEPPANAGKQRLPDVKWVMVVIALMALLAASGSAWRNNWSGIQTLESQGAHGSGQPPFRKPTKGFQPDQSHQFRGPGGFEGHRRGQRTLLLALLLSWYGWHRRLRRQAQKITSEAVQQIQHLQNADGQQNHLRRRSAQGAGGVGKTPGQPHANPRRHVAGL